MNIVYIIGNGFDINLGLKTRYSDFYKYYQSIKPESKIIEKLKKEILDNYDTWSDLEIALGKYTENMSSTEEFDEIFEDIIEKLALYLEEQENEFKSSNVNLEKFYNNLAYPESFLMKADEDKIKSYKEINGQNTNWKIDVITLNYTTIIEKIVNFDSKSIEIGKHNKDTKNIYLRSIEHIHGYLNDRMIIGVNDISQIKNSNFHKNNDVLNAIIKSNCNKVSKHTIDVLCEKNILAANLICIFGASLGDTDNIWWELIGEHMKNGCNLIIFERGEKISPRLTYKKDRRVQKIKNIFLNKTKLSEEEKSIVQERIFVGVNTNMFNII